MASKLPSCVQRVSDSYEIETAKVPEELYHVSGVGLGCFYQARCIPDDGFPTYSLISHDLQYSQATS